MCIAEIVNVYGRNRQCGWQCIRANVRRGELPGNGPDGYVIARFQNKYSCESGKMKPKY